jgi:hypothetical protein
MATGGDIDIYIGPQTNDAAANAWFSSRGYNQSPGYLYLDTTLGVLKIWDGSVWVPLGAGGGFVTAEGGFAVLLLNKTGSVSVKGTLVEPSPGTDGAFTTTGANAFDAMGAVYVSGIADGSLCPVVVGGIAEVLLEDGTASTRNYWARTSTSVGGRADITNAGPPGLVLTHFAEIGHCIESKASGTDVLAKIVMHFN